MIGSLLKDAFAHHVWATLRLIDACAELDAKRLSTATPGTYGSILETLRHLVASDRSYLFVTTGGRLPMVETDAMALPDLRSVVEANGPAWAELLEEDLDPDRWLIRRRDDGSETHAPIGIRLAQAIHHGTDHRSQVCTALTVLGIEPPEIDVWDYGMAHDRVRRTEP